MSGGGFYKGNMYCLSNANWLAYSFKRAIAHSPCLYHALSLALFLPLHFSLTTAHPPLLSSISISLLLSLSAHCPSPTQHRALCLNLNYNEVGVTGRGRGASANQRRGDQNVWDGETGRERKRDRLPHRYTEWLANITNNEGMCVLVHVNLSLNIA